MPEDVSLFSLVDWSPLHLVLPLVIAQRIGELRVARRNQKKLVERGAVEVGSGHYPAIVALHSLWFVAMIAEIIVLSRVINPFWIGLLLIFLCAQGLRYWTIRTLGERWTTRVYVIPGEKPVTGGPFRYLRHPNYVAVVTELLVLPLIFSCYVTAVAFSLVNAVLLTIRIRTEERAWNDYAESKQHT